MIIIIEENVHLKMGDSVTDDHLSVENLIKQEVALDAGALKVNISQRQINMIKSQTMETRERQLVTRVVRKVIWPGRVKQMRQMNEKEQLKKAETKSIW